MYIGWVKLRFVQNTENKFLTLKNYMSNHLKIKSFLLEPVFMAKLVRASQYLVMTPVGGKSHEDFVAHACDGVLTKKRNPRDVDVQDSKAAFKYMVNVIKSLASAARQLKETKSNHVVDDNQFPSVNSYEDDLITEEIDNESKELALIRIDKTRVILNKDEECLRCLDGLLKVYSSDDDVYEINKAVAEATGLSVKSVVLCKRKIDRALQKVFKNE